MIETLKECLKILCNRNDPGSSNDLLLMVKSFLGQINEIKDFKWNQRIVINTLKLVNILIKRLPLELLRENLDQIFISIWSIKEKIESLDDFWVLWLSLIKVLVGLGLRILPLTSDRVIYWVSRKELDFD